MEPKYKVGDKVWTLNRVKALEVEVTGVRWIKSTQGQKEGKDVPTIKYCYDSHAELWEDESFFFSSKQDLINSL